MAILKRMLPYLALPAVVCALLILAALASTQQHHAVEAARPDPAFILATLMFAVGLVIAAFSSVRYRRTSLSASLVTVGAVAFVAVALVAALSVAALGADGFSRTWFGPLSLLAVVLLQVVASSLVAAGLRARLDGLQDP